MPSELCHFVIYNSIKNCLRRPFDKIELKTPRDMQNDDKKFNFLFLFASFNLKLTMLAT